VTQAVTVKLDDELFLFLYWAILSFGVLALFKFSAYVAFAKHVITQPKIPRDFGEDLHFKVASNKGFLFQNAAGPHALRKGEHHTCDSLNDRTLL
jgi:hypothetical protein